MTTDEPQAEPADELDRELEGDEPAIADEFADEPTGDDEPRDTAADEPEARAPTAAELKRFEAENTRHEKALAKLIGRDWEHFAACSACGGVGFTPRELQAIPELQELPGAIECPGCKGYGRLLTPSRVPGQETQVCVDCAGNGWKRESPAAPAPPTATPAPPANGAGVAPPGYVLVKVDPNAPDYTAGYAPPAPAPPPAPAAA